MLWSHLNVLHYLKIIQIRRKKTKKKRKKPEEKQEKQNSELTCDRADWISIEQLTSSMVAFEALTNVLTSAPDNKPTSVTPDSVEASISSEFWIFIIFSWVRREKKPRTFMLRLTGRWALFSTSYFKLFRLNFQTFALFTVYTMVYSSAKAVILIEVLPVESFKFSHFSFLLTCLRSFFFVFSLLLWKFNYSNVSLFNIEWNF